MVSGNRLTRDRVSWQTRPVAMSLSPPGILRLCSLALLGVLLPGGALRGADEPGEAPVIKLPVYTVTDARELPPPE